MATCAICGVSPIPACVAVPAGFQRPHKTGSDKLDISQGPLGITLTAREEPVCRSCYCIEFARVYPGADIPDLPAELA